MTEPIDQVMPKAMGAVKDVKAVLKGLSGVFKHLMEEHGKVGALVQRLHGASDLKLRRELYPAVRAELLAHERAEVAVVYTLLEKVPGTEGVARTHSAEAEQLEAAIATVDALELADEAWDRAFARVAALVVAHVEDEESNFFPRAQAAIGDERAKELLPRYEASKKAAMAELDLSTRAKA